MHSVEFWTASSASVLTLVSAFAPEDYRYLSGRRIVTIRFRSGWTQPGRSQDPRRALLGSFQDPPESTAEPSKDPRGPPRPWRDPPRTLPSPAEPIPEALSEPLGTKNHQNTMEILHFRKIDTKISVIFSIYQQHENERLAYTRAPFRGVTTQQMMIFCKIKKCHFGPLACTRA